MIVCVNGTLYRLISNGINQKYLFYRWNAVNRPYQLISKSNGRSLTLSWGLLGPSFVTVPSHDLLLSVKMGWKQIGDQQVARIVVQRLYLKTGRRDMVYVQCDPESVDSELLKYLYSVFSLKGGSVLTANSKHVLLVGFELRDEKPWGKYRFLTLNISDHNNYSLDCSNNLDLAKLITKNFGRRSEYNLVGTTGSDGLLGAGMGRESIGIPLPVVICHLVEMYLGGERLHLITYREHCSGGFTKDVCRSIAVDQIMKGRIRVANQSEIVEIEHEIID